MKNKKGFTLVELVIVIAVIAILAAVLLPTFAGILERARENSRLQKITSTRNEYISANKDLVLSNLEDYVMMLDNNYYTMGDNGEITKFDGDLDKLQSQEGYAYAEIYNPTSFNDVVIYQKTDEVFVTSTIKVLGSDILIPFNEAVGTYITLDETNTQIVETSKQITEIVIPNTITSISNGAFSHNENLVSVVIPSSVVDFPECMFYCCTSLKNVTLPEGMETITFQMFAHSGIEELVLPSTIKVLEDTAFYCASIKNITLNEGLQIINYQAFDMCSQLESVNIPSTVTEIGECVFEGCKSLTQIEVHPDNNYFSNGTNNDLLIDLNTNTLLASEKNITQIDDTVVHIGKYALAYLNVTSFVLPSLVETIDFGAFYGCEQLNTITLNENLKEIGGWAFYQSAIKEILIPAKVEKIANDIFTNCYYLEKIEVDELNTVYDSRDNCNGIVETSTNTLIVACQITTISTSVKKIGSKAFNSVGYNGELYIPKNIEYIGYCALLGCGNIVFEEYSNWMATREGDENDTVEITASQLEENTYSIFNNEYYFYNFTKN